MVNFNVQYTIEEITKTANYLLNFPIEASIANGYIDDETIMISARSEGKRDVSKIMRTIGGGGMLYSAAKIKNDNIERVSKKILLNIENNSN